MIVILVGVLFTGFVDIFPEEKSKQKKAKQIKKDYEVELHPYLFLEKSIVNLFSNRLS